MGRRRAGQADLRRASAPSISFLRMRHEKEIHDMAQRSEALDALGSAIRWTTNELAEALGAGRALPDGIRLASRAQRPWRAP